ncbi:hypothetical protein BC939DRAFT_459074 [Gamsiella multidivaricata]|uniref:uncharacterized protein n=1 Tax=Gamsiella multidivaricata TaxID=101098 RepID=UPI0022202A6C|nr:uncharacterized protein BC939DRAFT_459074 [Gamsiella multidivaricata]KAI7819944.1 hypothetical protein BC939DRAFT_459074 [Gamsiella multidivaricata]
MDKTVLGWLLEVRKSNGVVSGLQLQVAADSVLHILADDIADDIGDFNDIPHGRTISFTTSWRSRMTQEYGVAYCSLRGEAGSVDKDAIAERMNEIRNICADFKPDATGLPLGYQAARELSTHSYTTAEFKSGAKPERGKSRVSILFCVNASGSSLDRADVTALRPQVLAPCSRYPTIA